MRLRLGLRGGELQNVQAGGIHEGQARHPWEGYPNSARQLYLVTRGEFLLQTHLAAQ